MNQIILQKTVNFKELVKNSNITLSLNVQTKMIDKLSQEFTEEEHQWYIANLYMYMNYHPTDDYPINLENVFKMIGFANKENAKRTLKNNFVEREDYKKLLVRTDEQVSNLKNGKNLGGAGMNHETVLLNIDTFKNLCMLVKTKKGREIRKYYVKLENIYNQIIKEEIEETQKQLEKSQIEIQEQQKKISLLENKPKTHGFLARRHGYVYMITDRSKLGHYKIGMTYNVDKRLRNLNTSSSEKSLSVYHEVESYDCELLEKTIHSILQPFNISNRREWFFFCNDMEIKYALHIINKIHNFLNNFNFTSYEQFVHYINKEAIDYKHHQKYHQEEPQEYYQEEPQEYYQEEPQENHQEEPQENLQPQEQQKQKENMVKVQDIKETNIFKLTGQQLKNKTGNYKGVCWCKEKQKWKAELKMAYKISFLGYYLNELECAKAYNDYALFINNRDNTNYLLNNIPDYIPNPRNIPEENEKLIADKKTSNYNGVSYDSKRKYYVSSIKYKSKSYALGNTPDEIECAKLYNQQALYFNEKFNTNYILNDIPGYITHSKNIYQEIQDKKRENKSSKYYGVTLSKRNNKYRAVIVHNKKQIHIGFFDNELDAAKAYNQKASELNLTTNFKYKINIFK
jgi:phage anti-repressor protein